MSGTANQQKATRWTRFKAFLVWLMARTLLATVRVRVLHRERLEEARSGGKPVLYAFWHGRQLVLFRANPEKSLAVLTSLSRDGELQSGVCQRYGITVVRGSSSRGGFLGLMALSKALKSGIAVGMAVDGPRGPAYRAKPGIVVLARNSGSPIVPITGGFRKQLALSKTWDRFLIPFPFTRATVAFGEPILVPPNASADEILRLTEKVTGGLRQLTEEVDAVFGLG